MKLDSLVMTMDPNMHLGHFYALLKSVGGQCADPVPPDPKDTSYVYGANSSFLTPSVTFSNQSILINGALACSTSFSTLVGALSLVFVGLLYVNNIDPLLPAFFPPT